MIQAVLIRFEGVIAQVTDSLIDYVDELVAPSQFDLPAAVSGFYQARRPWEHYVDGLLTDAGVPAGTVGDITQRLRNALTRPEAWRLYEDVPLALEWMRQRHIPVTIVCDWSVDVGRGLTLAGIDTNAVFIHRQGALTDVVAHETRRLEVMASELMYVAADVSGDFEDARSAGCYALVIDRHDRFDESLPNINHLVEIELHI